MPKALVTSTDAALDWEAKRMKDFAIEHLDNLRKMTFRLVVE